MTATQSLKIFEILQRHFKSSEDAKLVVQEIEEIVEEISKSNTSHEDVNIKIRDNVNYKYDEPILEEKSKH